MRGWLTRWNLPTPPATTMEHSESPLPGMLGRGQLDWLELLKGARFDLGFLTMMDTRHGGAIRVAESELRGGASAEVKALARQVLTTQTASLASCLGGRTPGCRTRVNRPAGDRQPLPVLGRRRPTPVSFPLGEDAGARPAKRS
jgi:hypothetical protein